MEHIILLEVNAHALLLVRIGGEKGFHFLPAFLRQSAVYVGMQIEFRKGYLWGGHLTTLSWAVALPRFISRRRSSRPRDKRDITVPTGTPRTFAASSYDNCSRPINKITSLFSAESFRSALFRSLKSSRSSCGGGVTGKLTSAL